MYVCVQVGREYKWSPSIKSADSMVRSGREHKWRDQKFMITIEDPVLDKIKLQCWTRPWFSADNVCTNISLLLIGQDGRRFPLLC